MKTEAIELLWIKISVKCSSDLLNVEKNDKEKTITGASYDNEGSPGGAKQRSGGHRDCLF
jgi:hypothetical protein